LLDASSDACCQLIPGAAQEESQFATYLSYRPERSEVMRAMKSIDAGVMRCFETHGESGLASVDFVIAADGHVKQVELSQGALAFRACVREQVKTLSFDPLQRDFKISFPFRK